MSTDQHDAGFYGISELSDHTGVNPVTLRAWERRYGLLKPQRTGKGHRLYTNVDIQTVRDILGWLEKGVAISRVRPLLGQIDSEPAQQDDADWSAMLSPAKEALAALDMRRLEQQFNKMLAEYPLAQVLTQWAAPLQGFATSQLPAQPAAAGMLRGLLCARLGMRQWQAARRDGRVARVLVLPVGAQDELALLTMTAVLLEAGLPALSLPVLPDSEGLRLLATQQNRVRALLLVLSPALTRTALNRALGTAPRYLSQPVFACGDGVRTLAALPASLVPLAGDAAAVASSLQQALKLSIQQGERRA